MLQDKEIKLIDYRNACYQGCLKDNKFDGLGLILTQDFLFSLAIWSNGLLNGPVFAVGNNQKIMYANFSRGQPQGPCCYEHSKECKVYWNFLSGKRSRKIAVVFPYLECVLQVSLNEKDFIEQQIQHGYTDDTKKWQIIQKIVNTKVPSILKNRNRFIKESFLNKNSFIQQIFGENELYIGAKNEGLGIKFDTKQGDVKSLGYFDDINVLKTIGKIVINKQTKVKEEGLYNMPESLVRYQQRPVQALKKFYRNYFRLSTNFENSFIQLSSLQALEKQFSSLITNLRDHTTKRIAQQLIEHLQDYQRLQNDQIKIKAIRQSRRDKSRKMDDVTLDQLKEELNRSMSHKKKNTSKSPYKEYQSNSKPAQLKYTSKIKHRSQDVENSKYPTENINRNNKTYGHYDEPDVNPFTYNSREQPRYREMIRNISPDRLIEPLIMNQRKENQRRYPIQQDFKPINRHNTSKSPIRVEQRRSPAKFKYYDDEDQRTVNPQRKLDFPYESRGYYGDNNNDIRPDLSPVRKTTTPTKNRLDKLSNMYDQIQSKSNKYQNQPDSRQKYTMNQGRGYHYNDDNQFDKQMGLVRATRKVQAPIRKSTSPYKPYNAPSSKYTSNNYDRPYEKYIERTIDSEYPDHGYTEYRQRKYFKNNR